MTKHGKEEKVFRTAFLLLGTNLGNRLNNLKLASEKLSGEHIKLIKSSYIYETAAWGKTDQPAFLNQALEISTTFSPNELMDFLLKVEKDCGRERLEKWGSRVIDIDIMYFEKEIIVSENLKIPHPELHNRRFALIPLADIAPDFIHPVLNLNTAGLLENCPDLLEVKKALNQDSDSF